MSERHKRCQHMNCCWRSTASVCRHFAGCIVSSVGCLCRPLRSITRRRHREYVRDDRAGVELVSVQQMSRSTSVCVSPYIANFPVLVDADGPREVQPFHRSWYPRYPTLLAISKALDELENTPIEKQKDRKDKPIDKPEALQCEALTTCDAAESMASTSKKKQQESEQQYDWDVWSVESLEWNFDEEDTGRSESSPSFG